MYSVLIVASLRLVREGMRALIERHKDFQVIGETDDRGHTVRLLGTLRPDVILFDLDPDHASAPKLQLTAISADRRTSVRCRRIAAVRVLLVWNACRTCALSKAARPNS